MNFFDTVWANKWAFLGTFFVVFTVSYIILVAVDFLPEAPTEETATDSVEAQVEETNEETVGETGASVEEVDEVEVETAQGVTDEDFQPAVVNSVETNTQSFTATYQGEAVLPIQISIPRIDKTIEVLNPVSRSIADLDQALLDGVVRHPDSANLAQDGNVFILGHSSYLPNVFNKNFQAFNGIQNLEWGDEITLYSEDSIYVYRVEKVYRANANDLTVPIAGTGKMLTLATCNSFGSVEDRYIVESKLVDVQPV